MLQLQIGKKGEIVIPKKVREHLGFVYERPLVLVVKEKSVEITSVSDMDIAKRWEERAKKANTNVSKWVYGDALYEEVF
ncbi:hypothetical protein HY484_02840 [Candidatus Woesearchaeota archaeon]|nr:hypothetical protein [Candidatus Woesearchaeota archaeon]